LPVDMFLAACLIDINTTTHTLTVWNGGLPPLVVYDSRQLAISQRTPRLSIYLWASLMVRVSAAEWR